jgi:ketosteroid isomerase-like protein
MFPTTVPAMVDLTTPTTASEATMSTSTTTTPHPADPQTADATHVATAAAGQSALISAADRNERVWTESSRLLYRGEIDEFLDLWTPDARYEVAYPTTGIPAVVQGKDAMRALFRGLTSAATSIEVQDVHFHQTIDPQVAIVQHRIVAALHGGGHYENLMIIQVTFRDGLIAQAFEYYGQQAHQDLLQQLASAG